MEQEREASEWKKSVRQTSGGGTLSVRQAACERSKSAESEASEWGKRVRQASEASEWNKSVRQASGARALILVFEVICMCGKCYAPAAQVMHSRFTLKYRKVYVSTFSIFLRDETRPDALEGHSCFTLLRRSSNEY